MRNAAVVAPSSNPSTTPAREGVRAERWPTSFGLRTTAAFTSAARRQSEDPALDISLEVGAAFDRLSGMCRPTTASSPRGGDR